MSRIGASDECKGHSFSDGDYRQTQHSGGALEHRIKDLLVVRTRQFMAGWSGNEDYSTLLLPYKYISCGAAHHYMTVKRSVI